MSEREPDAAPVPTPAPRGLGAAGAETFSLKQSMGGVRGLLESVIPITVFSLYFGITRDLRTSCIVALVPAVAFVLWRAVRREPVSQAIGGLLALGVGAFLAMRTGRSEAFFLPTIIKNVAYLAAFVISIVVRWPLIGLALGMFNSVADLGGERSAREVLRESTWWRQDPVALRAYTLASWFWVGMFAVRLAVQVPLFMLGKTAELGLLSVPLGLPLFGLTAYLTWLVVRRLPGRAGQETG